MQAFRLSMIVAAVFLLRVDSASAEGFYLGGHGGVNLAHDGELGNFDDVSYDPGFGAGLAVGYSWPSDLRTEIEFTVRGNRAELSSGGSIVDDSYLLAFSLMANAFHDFDAGANWIPYLGGGLGAVAGGYMFGPGAGEGAVFAYQIGAGVGYAVAESVVLSLDYRFFVASGADVDVIFGASSDLDFMTSTIWMGLRYEF